MPLKIKCPACGGIIGVPDTAVGKQVRCTKCQKVVAVKAPAPKPAEDDDAPAKPPSKTGVKTQPGKPNGKTPVKPPAVKKPAPPPRDDEDDEDDEDDDPKPTPKKKGSPVFMILGIVGGVFLLLCLGCGGVVTMIYWRVSSAWTEFKNDFDNEFNAGATGSGTNPFGNGDPFKPPAKINDLNAAVEAIKSTEAARKNSGADWLATAPFDQARQVEVARALDAVVNGSDLTSRIKAVKALEKWADKESVPAVAKALDEDKEGWGNETLKKEGFAILVKFKDDRGAKAIVRYLEKPIGDEPARKALTDMGPVAEAAVLPYFHVPHNGARDRARMVLQSFGTRPEVVVRQSNKDAHDNNPQRRQSAVNFLAEFKQPIPEVHVETGRALGALIANPDAPTREGACRALGVWGGKDSVPALIRVVEDPTMSPTADTMRRLAIESLGKLRDERAAKPIFAKLAVPAFRDVADRALVAMGPASEMELRAHIDDPDKTLRADAVRLLKAIGTKDNPDLIRALADVKSADPTRKRDGTSWFTRSVVDRATQAEVAAALEGCLEDQDMGVRENAARALMIWATPNNKVGLIKALNQENDRVRQPAIETLGLLKEVEAVPLLCALLGFSPKDRQRIVKALSDIGPRGEPEVVKYLQHQDKAVRIEACHVLQAIGTKASIPALTALGNAAVMLKQKDVENAVKAALVAIQSR